MTLVFMLVCLGAIAWIFRTGYQAETLTEIRPSRPAGWDTLVPGEESRMIPGERALVVDDSKSARVVLSRMLERYGILVDSADSA